ncbi:type II toxin-antitoxin system PemK/MazF family toxin [Pseudomonas sp. R2.Fl]|nr:type II toxin-antitoxin system PemK/MazF family toxin [Pseudomonas sp. R2.Fl]
MTIERGAVYTLAAKGAYTGKPRPAIVLQNTEVPFNSVVVVLTTTKSVDAPFFRIPIIPDATNGLSVPTYAMSEKITAVPKENLAKLLGHVDGATMRNIEEAVREVLGL